MFNAAYLLQTCDKSHSQIPPTHPAAILKYVSKYTLLVPSYSHQQCWITLWRWASDGDWTMGRPADPYAVECKFLGANKQPVVRGGWSSSRACVCSSVCGKDGEKKKRVVGGLQNARSRGLRDWSNSQSGVIFLLFLSFINTSQSFQSTLVRLILWNKMEIQLISSFVHTTYVFCCTLLYCYHSCGVKG